MCDTIVVVLEDRVLFAKASDRDANEAQALTWQPAQSHPAGTRVRCTWITIEQVAHTHAVVLSRPFWMFGAEMGANEHGLVIGNEAVFTTQRTRLSGLTGMDLLRLALERAETAEAAVETIVELLKKHGQGGGCGYASRDFTYHSSFLIADASGAFVLETAGELWEVERVEAGVRTISNTLSIPPFAAAHARRLEPAVACAASRAARTHQLSVGATSPQQLMRALRDHGPDNAWPRYNPINGTLNAPCMHGAGAAASSVSASAWVSELRRDEASHWTTATAGTCTSLFKPVSVGEPVASVGVPGKLADESLWWRHERFHRAVMRNPGELIPRFSADRDEQERSWVESPIGGVAAFAVADELLGEWSRRVERAEVDDVRPRHARRFWDRHSRDAGLL